MKPVRPTWIRDIQPLIAAHVKKLKLSEGESEADVEKLLHFRTLIDHIYHLRDQAFDEDVSVAGKEEPDPASSVLVQSIREDPESFELLKNWLEDPQHMEIITKEDLYLALQTAIELEHSTLPPYMTAMCSVVNLTCTDENPGGKWPIPEHLPNAAVANAIHDVFNEEMLHMCLSSNILISIGGSPAINQAGFIPQYPTQGLPGGLRPNLRVPIAKCSIGLIQKVFCGIEEPEVLGIHDVRVDGRTPGSRPTYYRLTIKSFYEQIQTALKELDADGTITFGNEDIQVSQEMWGPPGHEGEKTDGTVYVVGDVETAIKAIDEILDQGEGNSVSDPYAIGGYDKKELSHYFRFAEIVARQSLIKTDDGYAYEGDAISFDQRLVYNMVENPSDDLWADQPDILAKSKLFQNTYTTVLSQLHDVFNGKPSSLKDAIMTMFDLRKNLISLLRSEYKPGLRAGPVFNVTGELV